MTSNSRSDAMAMSHGNTVHQCASLCGMRHMQYEHTGVIVAVTPARSRGSTDVNSLRIDSMPTALSYTVPSHAQDAHWYSLAVFNPWALIASYDATRMTLSSVPRLSLIVSVDMLIRRIGKGQSRDIACT